MRLVRGLSLFHGPVFRGHFSTESGRTVLVGRFQEAGGVPAFLLFGVFAGALFVAEGEWSPLFILLNPFTFMAALEYAVFRHSFDDVADLIRSHIRSTYALDSSELTSRTDTLEPSPPN